MDYDTILKLMKLRGYHLYASGSNKKNLYFNRVMADITIQAKVDIEKEDIELTYAWGLLNISTGKFDLNHSKFDMFENAIIKAARKL